MASDTGNESNDDDRISQLPDSILSHILSSLPIKDAVSTSILSTRWRYLFVSMFNLDVNFYIFRRPPPHTVKSFTNLMDKLLFLHTEGNIQRFRLNYIDISGIHASHVCGWISAALWREVKEIELHFTSYENFLKLPTALLFTSKTLKRLKLVNLHVMGTMGVPINVCLPCLKTLELKGIVFEDDGSIKRLLSSCPVLQDLSISYCDIPSIKISNPSLKSLALFLSYSIPEPQLLSSTLGIVIDVPSLVYFKYVGCNTTYFSMVNMPSLVRSDIYIHGGFSPASDRDGLVTIFHGIGNVKSLHLTIYAESLPFLSQKRFVAYQNLIHLEILDSTKERKVVGLFEFLQLLPNLQILFISNISNEITFPMEKVPSCVVYQLKEFKLLSFYDETSLFKMVTYILKNATVLEKLTICTSEVLKVEEKFKITKQLLSLSRSSINCQVMAF